MLIMIDVKLTPNGLGPPTCLYEWVDRVQDVGTKGVSQNHLLSFNNNKVLKIINWTC